jgi:hypothetical protein
MPSTIPQLAELKRRLHELDMRKARGGYSVDPGVNMEADDLRTIIQQMELIDIQRRNLDILLRQRGTFGGQPPMHIINQINNSRAEIVRLRQVCARLGQNVPDHPVDSDEPESELPPVQAIRHQTQPPTDIRAKLDQIQRLLDEIRNAL